MGNTCACTLTSWGYQTINRRLRKRRVAGTTRNIVSDKIVEEGDEQGMAEENNQNHLT